MVNLVFLPLPRLDLVGHGTWVAGFSLVGGPSSVTSSVNARFALVNPHANRSPQAESSAWEVVSATFALVIDKTSSKFKGADGNSDLRTTENSDHCPVWNQEQMDVLRVERRGKVQQVGWTCSIATRINGKSCSDFVRTHFGPAVETCTKPGDPLSRPVDWSVFRSLIKQGGRKTPGLGRSPYLNYTHWFQNLQSDHEDHEVTS